MLNIFTDNNIISVERYLDTPFCIWCCLKKRNPDNPTQSENNMHKKLNTANEIVYIPYCSGESKFVYTGTITALPAIPNNFDGAYFNMSLKIGRSASSTSLSDFSLLFNKFYQILR